ncbi:MAG TPA: biotin/lipoyl-containing protein [Kofleriaceae bacterium]|jgi:acetyl-CoA carboxylase biotin carboxyl carrier protein
MTRFSARSLEVTSSRDGDHIVLKAPSPGLFLPSVVAGELVMQGTPLGDLDVLGERTTLLAPAGGGIVTGSVAAKTVSFGDALLVLDTSAAIGGAAASAPAVTTSATTGLVFKAPMSGRFYTRSAPDKPAFVEVGTELKAGSTVCLLEVMKTFNRVTYGGAGLPVSAKVTAILVADGADVTAGDPLLSLA